MVLDSLADYWAFHMHNIHPSLYFCQCARHFAPICHGLTDAVCSQQRMTVHAKAIVTHLVFTHALRIRMKAETSESPSSSTPTPDATSETVSINDDASVLNEEGAETSASENGASSATETAASRSKGKSRELASPSESATGTKVPDSTPEDKSSQTSNLVGLMNNLVTTDLDEIEDGRDWLMLGV